MSDAKTDANTATLTAAKALVSDLQSGLVSALTDVANRHGDTTAFERIEWKRDEGRHGGGSRYVVVESPTFNRVAVNVSHVHYDDMPEKRLSSATALSTIVHPHNPHAPSMHMHISWTALRDGSGGWRVMADLNPSITNDDDANLFRKAIEEAAPEHYAKANAQGDKYFTIPALERRRGVVHFYLEGFRSDDPTSDIALARRVGEAVIACYAGLVNAALSGHPTIEATDARQQLEYHTAYLFQVLTLDRGTTSGILVHDQNDVGILGSLPSYIDRELLLSWADKAPPPQDALVRALGDALPSQTPCPVTNDSRAKLAAIVRAHYKANPEALKLQASGFTLPTTVQNH